MNYKVAVVVGAVAVVVIAIAVYVKTKPSTAPSVGVTVPPMAEKLGISASSSPDDPEKAAEREMAMLQSGEAGKKIDSEIAKAEALIKKYDSKTDEHHMLVRRIAMLKNLKEKMSK